MAIKHAFSSSIPDGADTSLVRPSNWNAEHNVVGLDVGGQRVTSVADPSLQYDAANKNYVDFNTDGWDDVQGTVADGIAAVANSTLTKEAYGSVAWNCFFFRHDQADTLNYSFQMPHSWDNGSKVFFHLHVVPMVNPVATQVAAFTGAYAWTDIGGPLPTSAWTAFSATLSIGTTAALTHSIVSMFNNTPPSRTHESAFLNIYFNRDTGAADTYSTSKVGGTSQANLAFLGADLHFKKVKGGTLNPLPGEGETSGSAITSTSSVASLTASIV